MELLHPIICIEIMMSCSSIDNKCHGYIHSYVKYTAHLSYYYIFRFITKDILTSKFEYIYNFN